MSDVERLTEILAAHERWDGTDMNSHECSCGRWHNWIVEGDDPATSWAEHVAKIVTMTAVSHLSRRAHPTA